MQLIKHLSWDNLLAHMNRARLTRPSCALVVRNRTHRNREMIDCDPRAAAAAVGSTWVEHSEFEPKLLSGLYTTLYSRSLEIAIDMLWLGRSMVCRGPDRVIEKVLDTESLQ